MKISFFLPKRAWVGRVLLLTLLLMIGSTARANADADGVKSQAPIDVCLSAPDCMMLVNRAHKSAQNGQLVSALADYEEAYQRWTTPWLLFNIGRILQRMQRWQDAAMSYERYIANDATESTGQRDLAKKYLAEVSAELKQRAAIAAQTEVAATSEQKKVQPPPPERPSWTKKWWVWTLAGTVIAGTIAGVVIGTQPSTINESVPRYRPFE